MKSFSDIKVALRSDVLSIGLPAAMAMTGMACLLMPGVSALPFFLIWSVMTAAMCTVALTRRWGSRAGAWTLLIASVALAAGIVVNCHYYVVVWGPDDVSRPVLMNLDAWSAWNNALFENGRPDALRCDWPARGYGRFVGLIVAAFGADITYPLLFNAFCALATIILTGSIAARCAGSSMLGQRRMAAAAMIATACMCYFMVSGTILIKDCPLAMAVAMTVWGTLRMRHADTARGMAAILAATFIIYYCRPNYLILQIAAILFLVPGAGRANAWKCVAAAAVLAALWTYLQLSDNATDIAYYMGIEKSRFSGMPDDDHQHSLYHSLFSNYFSLSFAWRLLLLPVTTAIQFLIPLPWTFDKYLAFGPDMALAHFSFCRYAAGALIIYYAATRLWRKDQDGVLRAVTAVGLLFYLGSAFQYGGTVSRYGIPLISLLMPCVAHMALQWRSDRHLRQWCAAFAAAMACVLAVGYHFTT